MAGRKGGAPEADIAASPGGIAGSPWFEGAIVAIAVAFVIAMIHPGSVFATTTPTGGDLAAHVVGPHLLRYELLSHWRLTGWSPDWFAGFPAYTFYPVLPALAVVALDLVLPYTVAFKLVVAAAIVGVPIAAWTLGRLAALPRPTPALLAIGATGYLFDTSLTLAGGNFASTMAGEFSYALGLIALLVYLGVLLRWLRTGRGRVLTAVLLAVVVLCHPVMVFFEIVGTVAALAVAFAWGNARRIPALDYLIVFGGGALLSAFWYLPFVAEGHWETNPNFGKIVNYRLLLFPYPAVAEILIVGLAVLAVVYGLQRRDSVVAVLTALAVASLLATMVAPRGHIWNVRLQPPWMLSRSLLAALGVGEIARAARRVALGPVVALGAVVLIVGITWGVLPGLQRHETTVGTRTDLDVSLLGLPRIRTTFVRTWAATGFGGYERYPGAKEFEQLLTTMRSVGNQNGCGDAMWEMDSTQERYGSPLALEILPYATSGCIGSARGLLVDSSATDPYVELAEASLSLHPLRYVRGLPYGAFDAPIGVQQLRTLGVRYFLALSPEVANAVARQTGVTEIARSGPWHVFRISGADVVAPLPAEPVVITNAVAQGKWDQLAEQAFSQEPALDPPLAAGGPASWQRLGANQPQTRALPPVHISNIRQGGAHVSFDVDLTGVPVVVRVSDFPGWSVHGAAGPWRLDPNYMVVVPKRGHVELTQGRTAADVAGDALTLVGIGVLVAATLFAMRPSRSEPGTTDGPKPPPPNKPRSGKPSTGQGRKPKARQR
jgi:hypothetical protein